MQNFLLKLSFLKGKKLIEYGQICFYLGTCFLVTALPISGIFYLLAIAFSLINRTNLLFKDNWNKILLFISGLFIVSSLNFYFFRQLDERLYGFEKSFLIVHSKNTLPQ